ncbi:MAG: pyridoxamine 5'-phosphate oxidase family protein, partial [Acidimicrobiales bacterium]
MPTYCNIVARRGRITVLAGAITCPAGGITCGMSGHSSAVSGIPSGALGPGRSTRVRRLPERARYARAEIEAILDEGFVCHLGYLEGGRPAVLPTIYVRTGDVLYLHGAPGNRSLRSAAGAPACVSVSLLDGLVLARSWFHHSVNYRSVVAFGQAHEVRDREEKCEALRHIVDHVVPGRSGEARPPSEAELVKTRLVRFEIAEASAKVRTGGPG